MPAPTIAHAHTVLEQAIDLEDRLVPAQLRVGNVTRRAARPAGDGRLHSRTRSASLRGGCTLATLKSFYGVDIGEPSGSTAAATAEVVEVFELLKPKASKTPLIRIGGDIDGSYLVPDDLDGIAACFSPGVNRIKYFEDFLADRYGIQSHMCDFTCDVEEFKTPLKPGMQTFVKKWLDVSPGEDSISLEDWLRDRDSQGDLLLQMDIEGAEYRNILATSEGTLARFRVIVLEVHGLGKMLEAPILREVIAPFFQKLARSFTTVHAHPNNCCGDFTVPDTDIRIPNVLELTFIRNDHFVPAPGPAALPHPLDVGRNVPRKAPLFLSEAWCDYQRPLESRVKILEDTLRYRDDVGASSADAELSGALSLTMQSLQTLSTLVAPAPKRDGDLVEVAARPALRTELGLRHVEQDGCGAAPGQLLLPHGVRQGPVDPGGPRTPAPGAAHRGDEPSGRLPGAGEAHLRRARPKTGRRRREARLPDVRDRAVARRSLAGVRDRPPGRHVRGTSRSPRRWTPPSTSRT